jgi:hypothetical protein
VRLMPRKQVLSALLWISDAGSRRQDVSTCSIRFKPLHYRFSNSFSS